MRGVRRPLLFALGAVPDLSVAEKRQERAKMEAEGGSVAHSAEGTPAASDSQPTPKLETPALAARPSVDDGGNDTGMEHEDGAGAPNARGARDTHAPQKRYRLTDAMKFIIWQLVCLSNECCRIENEKKWVPRLRASACAVR